MTEEPNSVHDHLPTEVVDTTEHFTRVGAAYDMDRMQETRVVFFGAGGARAFADDLARTGIEEFVLVDADEVSTSNIATQQVRHAEIGRPKVECVAEQLQAINPNVRVRAAQRMLDDRMTDAELGRIAFAPFEGHGKPGTVLLCGFTDSFDAQARVNRIALHTGHPSLLAQVYHEGRGVELTFTHPDVTPACSRCALRSRYEAHLERGFENDVTSSGTPIFATTQLNALKGFIALALIHHGSEHPRWGNLLERIGSRNLVQMRLDPDIGATLGLSIFDDIFEGDEEENNRVIFGETVWLPQQPDHPDANGFSVCPECRGTGSLRDATGTLADTRVMPQYGQAGKK